MQPKNLAARAARWSAQHRKKAIFGWLAFVVLATLAGSMIGTNSLKDEDMGNGDSRKADQAVADANFPDRSGEQVLVQGKGSIKTSSPQFAAAVKDVERRLHDTKYVVKVESPLSSGNEGQLSKDGRSGLVTFDIKGDEDEAKDRVDPTLNAVAAAQKANPDLRIEQFGDASADKALSKSFEDDFKKAEFLSLPITLAVLLVAFGALVAAGLPLLLAVTAVAGTLGLMGPVSQLLPQSEQNSSVILLIGLAVGVDYVMFYLRREMAERDAGRSPEAALNAAAATSGRAVLISGLTVMVAMAGMYMAGNAVFVSMATGTILVVAVSVLGSLTVLPALLSKLGDKVEKGRVPFIGRMRHNRAEPRVWGAILSAVLRRPKLSVVLSAAVLLALAIPALGMKTVDPGTSGLPRKLEIMQTYDRIQASFPGGPLPAIAVVEAKDVTSPEVQKGIADLKAAALKTGQMANPIEVDTSPDKTVAMVEIPLAGTGTDAKSERALAALRDDVVPSTIATVPGTETNVSGVTAGSKDFGDSMSAHLPIVFAFVLGLAFLLLLVTFRSIVIPIKAIILNLLSVGAAYGVLKLVFQDGHGEGLLDFQSAGGVTTWLPLFLFVVLFGLSMDYHVLILSRIRELVDRGESNEDAVTHGIKSTAGVITSAAIVMVAVFGIFATLSAVEFKQMGIGLASAILIDATIVRAVLLPAAMKLLGEWNWYLPKSLGWLPHFKHEALPEPSRA